MLTSKNIRTITDMRKSTTQLLNFVARSREPVGILKHNKLAAYLVDPQTLESLETFVEDYLDLRIATSRLTKTKKTDFDDFEKFWKEKKLPR